MANTLPTTMEYFDNLLGEQLTEGGGSGGGGSLEFVVPEQTVAYSQEPILLNDVKEINIGDIIIAKLSPKEAPDYTAYFMGKVESTQMGVMINFSYEQRSAPVSMGERDGEWYLLYNATSSDNNSFSAIRFEPF